MKQEFSSSEKISLENLNKTHSQCFQKSVQKDFSFKVRQLLKEMGLSDMTNENPQKFSKSNDTTKSYLYMIERIKEQLETNINEQFYIYKSKVQAIEAQDKRKQMIKLEKMKADRYKDLVEIGKALVKQCEDPSELPGAEKEFFKTPKVLENESDLLKKAWTESLKAQSLAQA